MMLSAVCVIVEHCSVWALKSLYCVAAGGKVTLCALLNRNSGLCSRVALQWTAVVTVHTNRPPFKLPPGHHHSIMQTISWSRYTSNAEMILYCFFFVPVIVSGCLFFFYPSPSWTPSFLNHWQLHTDSAHFSFKKDCWKGQKINMIKPERQAVLM